MKRSIKKLFVTLAAAAFVFACAAAAYAAQLGYGQWCDEGGSDPNKRFWFALEKDGSKFLANTWYWIKDSDGVVRSYYFDYNGWLLVDQTVDGYTLDADGHWTVDGAVQTSDTMDFVEHSSNFLVIPGTSAQTAATSASSVTPSNTPSPTTSSDDDMITGVSKTVTDKTTSKKGTKTTYTTSTGGKISITKGYKAASMYNSSANKTGWTASSVNGQSVSNNWANFSINFTNVGGTVQRGSIEEGFDFMVASGEAELSVAYLPLDYYTAGNTNLSTFISSFLKDSKTGYKGGEKAGSYSWGAYTFQMIKIGEPNPAGTIYDYAYLRIVDGTNYVQIITTSKNGSSEDFSNALNTMARVR